MYHPDPGPTKILEAACNYQRTLSLDVGSLVSTHDAEVVTAFIAPLMLRPPSVDQVRELLDSAGALIDAEEDGGTRRHLAHARAINAAWRVGGERP